MPKTQIRKGQLEDEGVTRADLNSTVVGDAVIKKVIQGTGMANTSTGADAGTGDVTVGVNFGSSVGTVCQGNDARLNNFVEEASGQRTLISGLAPGSAGFLLVSGVAYFVYLGRVTAAFTPKFVEFYVSTIGAGAQVAEVGFFSTPNPPNKGSQSLTKLVSTGTIDALTSLGVKRNITAFAFSVLPGTHLWAGIRTAMATTQPNIWGVGLDFAQGRILTTAASGVLTGVGPWTGAIIAASTVMACPDLRGVLD
jgi:hypothetical protein